MQPLLKKQINCIYGGYQICNCYSREERRMMISSVQYAKEITMDECKNSCCNTSNVFEYECGNIQEKNTKFAKCPLNPAKKIFKETIQIAVMLTAYGIIISRCFKIQ